MPSSSWSRAPAPSIETNWWLELPIFAQLARGACRENFLVLRYDKRGVGQSGGRSERVTLQDYADDLITVVNWLAKRQDVDPNRIVVAGHSEGGAVAMLAAAREDEITHRSS